MTRPSGGATPAAARAVANRSIVTAGSWLTVPAGTRPGQRTMQGTRKPPSQVVPFIPRRPPVLPPYHGPLSLVKTTSVRSSIPRSSSLASTRPTLASSSAITSPYRPAPLFL